MSESHRAGSIPEAGEDKAYFEHLVSAVEDYAIFILDREGLVRSWNLGAKKIKGYEASEIIGRHFSCFYSEMDRLAKLPERELEIAGREGRFTDEGWRFRRDGSQFWANVALTAIRDAKGQIEGFLKITRDFTDRMEAAESLRQSEERFRLLLECVEEYAIFMLDPEGHVMSWNLGAARIKRYEPQEIIGRHFSLFYPDESLAANLPANLLAKAVREGKAEDEGWRVRKGGDRFWASVLITPVHDHDGELRGFAKITRDLTEKRAFDDLKESSERKDTFLATLAHELRNPLAPLLAGLDMINRSPGDGALVEKVAGTLDRQVKQMSRLIDDLLNMSRLRVGKISLRKTTSRLSEIVQSAIDTVQPAVSAKQQRLTLHEPDGVLQVEVDPERISQVLSNLLNNASKFTPDGGSITLDARVIGDATLELTVTDNGQGIPPEWQERIFSLFEQGPDAGQNGLGIGLTLVKDLVTLHGGTITVESAGENEGSTFRVLLPDAVVSRGISASSSPADDRKEGAARVLIADDGKSAADILGMFFRMEGMDAKVVYDGAQAVAALDSFSPDLILMDLGMPRMDGFEAARRIRQVLPDVVIVALSGWGAEEDRRRSAQAGFNEHLVKPVSPDELRKLVKRFLTHGGVEPS